MAKKTAESFEDSMARLEAITEEMEKGDAPLERLMQLHEEGMELASKLKMKLEGANARILEVRRDAEGKPVAEEATGGEQLGFLGEDGQ